jgi:phosphoglycerate dehydrogenase-like enzyme
MSAVSNSGAPRRSMVIWEFRGQALSERLDELKAAAPDFEIRFFDTRENLEANVGEAEVIATVGLSAPAIQSAMNLKWLHDWGAGMDKAIRPDVISHPLLLTCTKGSGAVPMAEWAMMHILMWVKNAEHYLDASREHSWSRLHNRELNGLTVGILGLGNSGTDLAQKCKAFHMRVLGLRRSEQTCPHVDELFTQDRLNELLAQSDFVVVTLPLTPETRGMLGVNEFRAMKSDAYIIVTSRAGIATDEALLQALEESWIAGAALDAHSKEPLPPDSPFWTTPSIFVSPHCSATGQNMAQRSVDIFIENVRRYVSGQRLVNIVDKVAGY